MLWVEVTPDDIRHGERNDPEYCPISFAVWRASGIHFDVELDHLTLPGHDGAWGLPAVARKFVREFDAGVAVEPIRFEIDLGPVPRYAYAPVTEFWRAAYDRRNRDRRHLAATA
jgi:hypothetical protein